MMVGAGCGMIVDAVAASARHAASGSTPARVMRSVMPVIRVTAGGMRALSGIAIRQARGGVMVAPARAQPISRRCPRDATEVAWQSTTNTSSSESGNAGAAASIEEPA
jgi:hypothetical protein